MGDGRLGAWLGVLLLAGSLVLASPPEAKENSPAADYGLVSGGDEPIHFVADEATADHRAGWVRFTGNVVVTQGDSILRCDVLEIRYAQPADGAAAPGGGQIREVIASGNVRMNQKDRHATCGKARYLAETRTVELTGDPVVWQGADRLSGRRIEIFLDTNRVRVTGGPGDGERVRVVVHPKEGGSLLGTLGRSSDGKEEDGNPARP